MANRKEFSGMACPSPSGCEQRHFEIVLVDDQGDGGNAIEVFCINTLTREQLRMFKQFVKSVTNTVPLLRRQPCEVRRRYEPQARSKACFECPD